MVTTVSMCGIDNRLSDDRCGDGYSTINDTRIILFNDRFKIISHNIVSGNDLLRFVLYRKHFEKKKEIAFVLLEL